MGVRFKKAAITVIYLLLPLVAILTLGVSSFLWYRALKPEAVKIPEFILSRISPEDFSAGLEGNLPGILSDNGIEKNNITVSAADSLQDRGIKNIYRVRVPENISLTLLNVKINMMAHQMGGRAFQGIEGADGKTLTIKVGAGSTPTDIIILRNISGLQAKIGKIAIIVDDLGIKNLDLTRRICNLKQGVTLSILPFQHHTSEVVDIASETGTPYMLHMPMEPKSMSANPGKGAIYTSDKDSEIREKLTRAFKNVSGAQGLNNHMGSKVTEDMRTMKITIEYLYENGYFFVDSRTSINSKGYYLSQKSGVKSANMYSFIDVEDDKDFIEQRLEDIAKAAFEKGTVVAICHDRPTTVEVLKKLPELEARGIKFVRVSEVVY